VPFGPAEFCEASFRAGESGEVLFRAGERGVVLSRGAESDVVSIPGAVVGAVPDLADLTGTIGVVPGRAVSSGSARPDVTAAAADPAGRALGVPSPARRSRPRSLRGMLGPPPFSVRATTS
jgi:hypothetical protein